MSAFSPFVMTVEAGCLKRTNGSYVYTAEAYFTLTETIVGSRASWDLDVENSLIGVGG